MTSNKHQQARWGAEFAVVVAFCRRHPTLAAFMVFFAWSVTVATLVQFVILPVLLPTLNAGHGLLKGTDSIGYHDIAVTLAAEMTRFDWGRWQLAPNGHSAAGLAAVFYALIAPEPWALIPINSLLHALAGVTVMRILLLLTNRSAVAFAGGALWIVLPTTLQWVSQIGKDGYFFCGMLASLLGWLLLLQAASQARALWRVLEAMAILSGGAMLAGLVRQYGLFQLEVIGVLMVLFALPVIWQRHRRGRVSLSRALFVMGLFGVIPFALSMLPKGSFLVEPLAPGPKAVVSSAGHAESAANLLSVMPSQDAGWQSSDMLPARIDDFSKRIAGARFGYLGNDYRGAGSMIDLDVQFYNAASLLVYLPRAFQIALLAPFPKHWMEEGHSPGAAIMRRVAGAEMVLLYPLLIIGLPFAVGRWRKRPEMWMTLVFCVPIIVGYAYTTPNLGSLYRLRYGFLLMLAALGMAGLGDRMFRTSSADLAKKNS
jgi:hypothetical protein